MSWTSKPDDAPQTQTPAEQDRADYQATQHSDDSRAGVPSGLGHPTTPASYGR